MTNKYMKRYVTSLVIRKMQIKIMRYPFKSTKTAKIKMTDNTKSWGECRIPGALEYCWYKCKMIQSLWKTDLQFLKMLKIYTLIIQSSNSILRKK